MSKDQFDAAIGVAPPSTVDIEAVLDRERHRARVRRFVNPWTAARAGVAAVAVVAVVVLTLGAPATEGFAVRAGTRLRRRPRPPIPAELPVPAADRRPDPGTLGGRSGPADDVLTAAVGQRVAAGTELEPNSPGRVPEGDRSTGR